MNRRGYRGIAISLAIVAAIFFAFFVGSIPFEEHRNAHNQLRAFEGQQKKASEDDYGYTESLRMQDNYWLKISKSTLVVFCILAGGAGAALGYFGVWAIYKIIEWIVLNYRGVVDEYREEKGGAVRSGTPRQAKRGEMMWVRCKNPDCKISYQMDKGDYRRYMDEHRSALAASVPALVCEACGKKTVYKAVKCGRCGLIFFRGAVANDFSDRCPKCDYSEEARWSR